MTRYEVRHRTEYAYSGDVTTSYGWAYLTPRDLPGQRCLSSEVEITPAATRIAAETDFHGNRATYFEVHEPHEQLTVTATSVVEVTRPKPDLEALDVLSLADARAALRADPVAWRAAAEFRLTSPRLPFTSRLPEFAGSVLEPGKPLGTTLRELVHAIYSGFAYRSGATTVSTRLEEVLDRREGVCQDFAHLAVASLRWAGLPARYVSGYVETRPPPGRPKLQGVDASHAWVSVLVPGAGWIDLDPTNDKVVDAQYVTTAWGRDYTDVPPLKGVIFTESTSSSMRVAVDVIDLGL
jgi:transglutaminase-like putative cysteine protease